MKKIVLCLLSALTIFSVVAQENLKTGKQYYEWGEYARALPSLQAAAKEGFGEACYMLGQMYDYGQGVEVNYPIAMRMYLRGVEYGYTEGEAEVGQMYQYGHGVPKNIDKALAYYRQSVDKGSLWGKCRLGICYYYGEGVEQDYVKAFGLLKEAAETYLFAMQMVGRCYDYGRGVDQNFPQAHSYYTRSRQPDALYRAAIISNDGDRKNNEKGGYAYQTMLEAIKVGCRMPEAYYYAGLWKDQNRVYIGAVPAYYEYDEESPFRLMTIAANAGYGPAQKKLGDWYAEGLYVPVNLPRARELYAKARANGIEIDE